MFFFKRGQKKKEKKEKREERKAEARAYHLLQSKYPRAATARLCTRATEGEMDERMDGWMDGWVGGWMKGM